MPSQKFEGRNESLKNGEFGEMDGDSLFDNNDLMFNSEDS